MESRWIVVIIALVVLSLPVIIATSDQKEKARVIAHTDEELAHALAKGCRVVREVRSLSALMCDQDVALSLGLQEDIRMYALDSGANKQIKADLVHGSGNTGIGRRVVILDTGYNYNHRELNSSYGGGRDFVNDDLDPFDDNGHGSHVAGIITADGIDPLAKGVAPGTEIIVGKVLNAQGSGFFSDVVAAIYWAVDGYDGLPDTADDFHADAISLSIGTAPPYTYKGFCDNVLYDLTNAIKYAVDKNVIVSVAAGNSGSAGVSIPGCISYSTTVGAVDARDKLASFSGKGSAVDLTAPGVSLYSSWLGTSYVKASGTSMATPVVSGTIALIKAMHPTYTTSQVQTALFNTAKDLGKAGKDTSFGWGRVDASAAVNYLIL